jgi:hypothetical protein
MTLGGEWSRKKDETIHFRCILLFEGNAGDTSKIYIGV